MSGIRKRKKGNRFDTRECKRHGKMHIDNFYRFDQSDGGYQYICRFCRKDYYRRNINYLRDYARAYSKKYYKKNKEVILNKMSKKYMRDREKIHKHYLDNRESILEKNRQYRKKNPNYNALYYQRNRKSILSKARKKWRLGKAAKGPGGGI